MEKCLTGVHYLLLYVLTFLPLAMVLTAFPFVPDPMPAHFSLSGEVNRWGSRYELFLMPVISAITGAIMIWATKFSEKNDDHAGRMMFFATLITMIILIAATAFILFMVMTYEG